MNLESELIDIDWKLEFNKDGEEVRIVRYEDYFLSNGDFFYTENFSKDVDNYFWERG